MNATLEKELAALSVQGKGEVIDRLFPDVVGEDEQFSPELLGEPDRLDAAHEAAPSGALSPRGFDRQWFGGERHPAHLDLCSALLPA